MMANEASYPENARGLAMNGCEIAYRGPYPAPGVMSGMFSVQNRARALDNNMYVIGMNLGTYYLDKDSTTPIDTFSGGSQIVDYRGQIVTEVPYGRAPPGSRAPSTSRRCATSARPRSGTTG